MDREVIDQIRDHLFPYLASLGIKLTDKKFTCFTKMHSDSTPSCHIVPSSKGTAWYCFGCNSSGDIFTAAHFLEGLPIDGADFWKVTVPTLARKLNIPFEETTLTPADKERYQLLAVHRDAADFIMTSLSKETSVVKKYLTERKWNIETARTLGIGALDSFEAYSNHMKQQGWSHEFLERSGLLDKRIFNRNSLLFIIKDLNSRPVAFAARNMLIKSHEDEEKYGSKYINSPLSPIYSKGSILYMLDQCKGIPGPLWVVEGYPDAATMWQGGIKKVCAIGGTAFTSPSEMHKDGDNHLDVLIENGFTNLVLCLDGDKMGIHNTNKIITEHLPKDLTISAKVYPFPLGHDDPDKFIGDKGMEEFKKIQPISTFEWKLGNLEYNTDPAEVANMFVPMIVEEPNAMTRWEMCRALAAKTNIPPTTINEEVSSRLSGDQASANARVTNALRQMQKKLYRVTDPEVVISIVGDAHVEMVKAMDNTPQQNDDYGSRILSVRNALTNPLISNRVSCGKFTQIQKGIGGGFPLDARYILLTGFANVGKSSFLRNLSWELARSNENLHIIYMSTDDSFYSMLCGYVSLYTSIDKEKIENPQELEKYPAAKESMWQAFDILNKMQDRLEIKDSTNGNTLYSVEKHITTAMTKWPDKKLVLIIDSFNKFRDIDGEDPGIVSSASKKLKYICQKYNIPMIVNVELRKVAWSNRATIRDMRGSSSLEFDADLVWIMQQNLNSDKGSFMNWRAPQCERILPINELEFPKNKISSFKEKVYIKFDSRRSQMQEVTEAQIKGLIDKEAERIRDREQWRIGNRPAPRSTSGPTPSEGTEGGKS